jgi:hypothetical protein
MQHKPTAPQGQEKPSRGLLVRDRAHKTSMDARHARAQKQFNFQTGKYFVMIIVSHEALKIEVGSTRSVHAISER